ncbi:MAG: 50S ribosomal protein L29 [Acidimicrobiales bacterium]
MADEKLTDLADQSLIEELGTAKRELFNLRFQLATGQLENTARMNQVRKHVARVRTEIRSREIAAAEAATASTTRGDS